VDYNELKRHLCTLKDGRWLEPLGLTVDVNCDFQGLLIQFLRLMKDLKDSDGLPDEVMRFYTAMIKEGEPSQDSNILDCRNFIVDGMGGYTLPNPQELLDNLYNLPENTEGYDTYKNPMTGLTPRMVMLELFGNVAENGNYVDDLMPQFLPPHLLVSLCDGHADMQLAIEMAVSVILLANSPENQVKLDVVTYTKYQESYRRACVIEYYRRGGFITVDGPAFTPNNVLTLETDSPAWPSTIKGPEGMIIEPTPEGIAAMKGPENN
jgi:hypothetical protein